MEGKELDELSDEDKIIGAAPSGIEPTDPIGNEIRPGAASILPAAIQFVSGAFAHIDNIGSVIKRRGLGCPEAEFTLGAAPRRVTGYSGTGVTGDPIAGIPGRLVKAGIFHSCIVDLH